MTGLAPLPMIPCYSASKAAALNLTQSLESAPWPAKAFPSMPSSSAPFDTDMNRGFNVEKVWTESAAVGIFDGLERGLATVNVNMVIYNRIW